MTASGERHEKLWPEEAIKDRYHVYWAPGGCAAQGGTIWPVAAPLIVQGCGWAKAMEDVGEGWRQLGGVMAEFLRFTLDDGSQVLFESAESDLVAPRGGQPVVREGGRLTERLHGVAEA